MPVFAAPSWPIAAYSYYAKGESVQDVLRDFAGGFSLALQMTPGLQGTVSGKFNASSPTDFMDKLGGVYGFNWFVYAGTLFVSRASDMTTRSISAMGGSIGQLRQALVQLGVIDARFGWGELPDQGVALISGPPSYVDLVERTVAALPMGGGGQQVAIFRLKHASVNDRVISYRSQQVSTPGLATMLRNLIQGNGGNHALSEIAAPLRENPPNFFDAGGPAVEVNTVAQAAAEPVRAKSGRPIGRANVIGREPSIQADTRLNAIVVQDIPDRMPIYRKLIEQLDVPSTLVEIEAMIVDVNSDAINELGVTWGANVGRASLGYGDLALTPSNGLPINPSAKLTPGTMALSVGSTLVARVRALQSKGVANILSQPSILTADNLGAMIDLSETFYIQTTGERVATVTPVTVGTSLRVTPRYIDRPDGAQVELTVDIEDGSVQQGVEVDGLPTVKKSNISTLAVVGDQQTLLIGGYNSTQKEDKVDKVPILGDIPFLGALFSSKSNTSKRRERLFLLRPRVVAINGQSVTASAANLANPLPGGISARNPSMGTALSIPWGTEVDQTSDAFLDRVQSESMLRMVDSRSTVLQVPASAMPTQAPISPRASALP
ncbi:type III secretion system outer membrane ring subunit SctC [Achromobacter marplatensis]|uniref:type III secretion system outer membrane ring subunit SctC n=1 Tax=Achromobacter marplatensis TaxID=470868 RepID=UPI0039F68116